MGAEEIQHAEHPVPIGELISVAETIEQIVYIAHRIRREKPGGQEWNQLNKRAEFIYSCLYFSYIK